MRLCIPLDSNVIEQARVCEHFGHAPFLALVDSASGEFEILPNASAGHDHGSGNCGMANRMDALSVDAVACQGLGRGIFARLQRSGVRMFRLGPVGLEEAIATVQGETAEAFTMEHTCAGGHQHHH